LFSSITDKSPDHLHPQNLFNSDLWAGRWVGGAPALVKEKHSKKEELLARGWIRGARSGDVNFHN
jgi:hypothetical protein